MERSAARLEAFGSQGRLPEHLIAAIGLLSAVVIIIFVVVIVAFLIAAAHDDLPDLVIQLPVCRRHSRWHGVNAVCDHGWHEHSS